MLSSSTTQDGIHRSDLMQQTEETEEIATLHSHHQRPLQKGHEAHRDTVGQAIIVERKCHVNERNHTHAQSVLHAPVQPIHTVEKRQSRSKGRSKLPKASTGNSRNRPSCKQLLSMLSDYGKLPREHGGKCMIGERQINRFAQLVGSTLQFAAVTSDNQVSVPRGQKIMDAFLRNKKTSIFRKNSSTAARDRQKFDTALSMQKNIFDLLKILRGNSTNEACMLRNLLYSAILPGNQTPSSFTKGNTGPDHREIQQIVNCVAEAFNVKNSTNPKQIIKAQIMRAYRTRCRFTVDKDLSQMLHYQRKRRGYHSQTSRSNDSEIEPITNVDTEPTSLSQFYEDVQSRETTMETITDTHVSKRSRRKR